MLPRLPSNTQAQGTLLPRHPKQLSSQTAEQGSHGLSSTSRQALRAQSSHSIHSEVPMRPCVSGRATHHAGGGFPTSNAPLAVRRSSYPTPRIVQMTPLPPSSATSRALTVQQCRD